MAFEHAQLNIALAWYRSPVLGEWQSLRFYGSPADHEPLAWTWVEGQLLASGIYWTVARSDGHPHPRPVWGVWQSSRLYLSIGTPALRSALDVDPAIAVHLESGTDVVIVEGSAEGRSDDARVIAAYDEKYDWSYDVAEYGPLTAVTPKRVLAWQASGWAGRESFTRSGRWAFDQ
jgi:hypothetical protein